MKYTQELLEDRYQGLSMNVISSYTGLSIDVCRVPRSLTVAIVRVEALSTWWTEYFRSVNIMEIGIVYVRYETFIV